MHKTAYSRRLPLAYCFAISRSSSKDLGGDFLLRLPRVSCTSFSHRPSKCRESLVLIINIAQKGGTWERCENGNPRCLGNGETVPTRRKCNDICSAIFMDSIAGRCLLWRACYSSGCICRSHNNGRYRDTLGVFKMSTFKGGSRTSAEVDLGYSEAVNNKAEVVNNFCSCMNPAKPSQTAETLLADVYEC